MFTGIIESIGKVTSVQEEDTNVHFEVSSDFTNELKIDQSVAHNGVCLTVVHIEGNKYTVTAIKETLDRTNLGGLNTGDQVNLERCTKLGDRLDGHIVQGHVDEIGWIKDIEDENGSWKITIGYDPQSQNVTIPKGSITVNGVSLTVVDSFDGGFSIAVIPFTFDHTNLGQLSKGDQVNLEFDVVGKYVSRLLGGNNFKR